MSKVNVDDITGHWKAINFEEEADMDELKVYTGKEALQALLNRKVLKGKKNNNNYRIEKDSFEVDFLKGNGWEHSFINLNNILEMKFTEVAIPQEGDWVRVKLLGDLTRVAQVNDIDGVTMWADWGGGKKYYKVSDVEWEILSPEQVSEYKREQAFVKVGRKLNEFKADDIVFVDGIGEVAVVISKENSGEFIKIHLINKAHGLKAKPHQIRPISFVEHQVNLD